MDKDLDLESDFLPDPQEEKPEQNNITEFNIADQLSNPLVPILSNVTQKQREEIQTFMKRMRYGMQTAAAIPCKDERCNFYSKCPLVRAGIPRPLNQDCPVELALMEQWLVQFIEASAVDLQYLSAYDMLLIQDLVYQQLLEYRAAMELSDNPQIQVKTLVGIDPNDGTPMYTYTLNNLIMFREKSSKMKTKLLSELIATARAKEQSDKGRRDKSTAMAEKMKRIEEKLGLNQIKPK